MKLIVAAVDTPFLYLAKKICPAPEVEEAGITGS
jgi:uncharacterized PurR-regulated membrane protein YhhQ (DUF165 family)